ncbi:unnamed protein product [Bursaphelenchus okinawaensis]|uniref:Uncharacterized protein n=1 Tax=Bursaphelenchus okinawaensis TaxID=465554 RepID=A0A811LTF1_9BILA|nr:unnamed protein product [Bursaphelenchus okinawaensis]CAG9128254.1 unnamed protein product [Bursaphelenchus okinawaensis]
MERMMCNVKLRWGIRSKRIRRWTGLDEVVVKATERKWKFGRIVVRMPEDRWERKIATWQPDGKRPIGRPRTRWQDEIRKKVGIGWMEAEDGRWQEALRHYTEGIKAYCHM